VTLVLRYAARSDRGLIRGNNQDSVYAGPRLLAVADGMGGHAAGDVASKVVIAALEHLDEDAPSGDMLQALRQAVFEGSEHLREVIRESPQLEGMGTTLTAILFAGGRLALCHVGDSRAYLVRDGQFSQITHDDTFVQTLIDDGRITAEEANSHPQRSLLLRALNGQDVEPDLSMREARAGDRYLLCSDGLSGVVSEETLAEALKDPDPQATADRLIELALRSGGPDNVTVIVADVVDDDGRGSLMEPVVDGAAGGNVGQRQVDARSAAGRAALADPPAPPPPTPTLPTGGGSSARRRPLRLLLGAVALLAVLVAGSVLTYNWALGHWFVAVEGAGEDGQVAVFRGLDFSVVG
jgi:protein phosphatase